MHIHGAVGIQFAALVPTQSTQQASVARKAAADVRRKLAEIGHSGDVDSVSDVDAYVPGDRGRRQNPPQDQGAFRAVLISMRA